MSDDDPQSELERLRAENERLKKKTERTTSLKVSEKGGVSVYGLGRFPVTLYKEQWTKLHDMADEIREFIRVNEDEGGGRMKNPRNAVGDRLPTARLVRGACTATDPRSSSPAASGPPGRWPRCRPGARRRRPRPPSP